MLEFIDYSYHLNKINKYGFSNNQVNQCFYVLSNDIWFKKIKNIIQKPQAFLLISSLLFLITSLPLLIYYFGSFNNIIEIKYFNETETIYYKK